MDVLRDQVILQLAEEVPNCAVDELSFVSSNSIFTTFGGASEDGRLLAVKIAHEHVADTSHNHHWTARDILNQEALLLTHCRSHALPAPFVHGKSRLSSQGLNFIVTDWLDDDHVMPDSFFMGTIMNRLHNINPPAFEPVAQRGMPLEKMLSAAILERAVSVTRLTQRSFMLPSESELIAHLSWPDRRTSLLHMNFNPNRLPSVNGVITGIVDWSKALIGPPTLELMGLDERGLLDDSFLGGYANYEMFRAPPPTETALRLYNVTETALNFVTKGTVDPDQSDKLLNRMTFLFEEFANSCR